MAYRMAVSELGRAPAVDRTSDELLRADEEREADENDHCVLTTHTNGFSTPAIYSHIFHSCIFHPCCLLPHFHTPRTVATPHYGVELSFKRF